MIWLTIVAVLLVAVGTTVLAATALAVGSLLAHIFALTTFEASVIVLAIAAGWVLLLRAESSAANDGVLVDTEGDDLPFVLRAVSVPTRRTMRCRKR